MPFHPRTLVPPRMVKMPSAPSTVPSSFSIRTILLAGNAQLSEDGHHRAPVGEGGLKQVEANERRKEIPIRTDPVAKRERHQDDGAGDHAQIAIHGHTCLLLWEI